jgi:hypothetical protein
MTMLHLRPAGLDAVVSFYALIHVPIFGQRVLFPAIRSWLRPGGYLLAITGARRRTGTETYLGADMFWDQADTANLPGLAGSTAHPDLAPLHPRRRPRAQPHPLPCLLTTARPAA